MPIKHLCIEFSLIKGTVAYVDLAVPDGVEWRKALNDLRKNVIDASPDEVPTMLINQFSKGGVSSHVKWSRAAQSKLEFRVVQDPRDRRRCVNCKHCVDNHQDCPVSTKYICDALDEGLGEQSAQDGILCLTEQLFEPKEG